MQLGGVAIVSSNKVIFLTVSGKTIEVDGGAKTCNIEMMGAIYPCGDGTTDAFKPDHGRRVFTRRASFLTTQGSFTLSSGSGSNVLGTGGGR